MKNARWPGIVGVLAVAACGGDSGGGGSTPVAEGLPPFCQEALGAVQDYMASAAEHRRAGPRYGGTAVVGVVSDIVDGMNVFALSEYSSGQHQTFVNLMTLVRFDEELEPEPYLAESWELSEDGTELTFTLRDDVVWHDGTPTTARDVAFTYNTANHEDTGFPNATWWTRYETGPDAVEVIDDRTIRFRLQPHLGYMDGWRAMAIMPEHLLGDVPPSELEQHPFGTRCPVGNGPFVFVNRIDDDRWTFAANPVFPEGAGGQPYLDRYVYRVIPDQSTLMAELEAGGVDAYIQPAIEQAPTIEAADDLDLLAFPHRSYAMVIWNARSPRLADKRVRQAIAHAVNRRQMLAVLRQGYGTLANATVPPFHWAYDASIEDRMPYNPGRAEVLLEQAGWVDRDGDGVRENASGEPLELLLKTHPESQERTDIAQIFQAELIQVGIRVTIESVEFATLVAQITTPERGFDGVTLGWAVEFSVDDTDLFSSAEIDGDLAMSGTDNPRIDEMLERIVATADREELRGLLTEYQELIIDEQPYTFLYYGDRLVGMNRRIQGVEMDVRGEWLNLADWWIAEDQRKYGTDD